MSQSRTMSSAEVLVSTALGYGVAVATQSVVFPLFGVFVPFHENLMMGLVFTLVSLARGYAVRRLFNYLGGSDVKAS